MKIQASGQDVSCEKFQCNVYFIVETTANVKPVGSCEE